MNIPKRVNSAVGFFSAVFCRYEKSAETKIADYS